VSSARTVTANRSSLITFSWKINLFVSQGIVEDFEEFSSTNIDGSKTEDKMVGGMVANKTFCCSVRQRTVGLEGKGTCQHRGRYI
jgi:hypothetical protein